MIGSRVLVPMRVAPIAYSLGIVEAIRNGMVNVTIFYAGNRFGRVSQAFYMGM